ncbi:hemerythrin domain-containing protein [Thiohalomonas denitrificans]|uniref:Hemerythrin HHE cation binding domain-containing protein n=1 Tax=Thiohalomonas denitrificans TaxID=415747 RepID=A0A1G5PS94_9GAMM|nr:hemerythrin domain-containing protein [Thiohalomonas denitrificans]SCZ51919.1 Hemerythrin HHE cation binding domain-containing protein [Thiohalomonas denitrificans]
MSESPFPSAAPDFKDPLGLLRACHDRILSHCETLERLVAHLRDKGVDADARKAAGKVHRYFSTAGKHHHEDEEKDLFPLLSQVSLKLADAVHRMKKDHERMDAAWQQLAPELERLGRLEDLDLFEAHVNEFNSAYRDHIATENEDILDIAQHLLSTDQLKRLGKAMASRRGQNV